jgi:hypothetical protein
MLKLKRVRGLEGPVHCGAYLDADVGSLLREENKYGARVSYVRAVFEDRFRRECEDVIR